jgi:hypothetical protein
MQTPGFRDVLLIWWEALSPDYEFLSTYEESVLRDKKSINDHENTVEQLGNVLRQRDSRNIELWSGCLLNTLQRYVGQVAQSAKDKAARAEGAGEKSEASKARDDYRRTLLFATRIEQADLTQRLRATVKEARAAAKEAQGAAESAKTAAGVASGAHLTKRFAALSQHQLRTATQFRWLTAVGVLLGIVGTYWIVFAAGVPSRRNDNRRCDHQSVPPGRCLGAGDLLR